MILTVYTTAVEPEIFRKRLMRCNLFEAHKDGWRTIKELDRQERTLFYFAGISDKDCGKMGRVLCKLKNEFTLKFRFSNRLD